jgi:hypothetical protein
MGKFQVQAPDGHVYEFEAPEGATPQQLDAMSREAAGYAKNYPVTTGSKPSAPEPSIGKQLVDATVNDVAGIVQGAAALPDLAAKGVGKVVSTIPTALGYGLDKLGYGDAGNYMHGVAHNLANPFQIGETVEKIAPTPENTAGKVGRFASQMVGGAVGFPGSAAENLTAKIAGEVPKGFVPASETVAKVAAPSIVKDAEQAGVRVMTSDVKPPRTFIGKTAQAVGERIPITGTGGPRAAQQTERINAVKSAAQEFGAANGDELASPAVDAVAKDLATKRGALLTRLTAQKNAVIDKLHGSVPTEGASQAIDQEISKLEATGLNSYTPVIAKLNDFKQALQNKNLSAIEMIRKQVGEDFKAPDMASVRGVAEKALSNIYGPLREDMGAYIRANGDPADFNKWKQANDQLANMVGDLKNTAMKRALRNADTTPEDVASLLFSQKPSDVRLLYDGLSSAGRGKAQAAILQKAIEKAGGLENISPDRFANQVNGLGKSVGVFFRGDDMRRIEGLTRVLDATKRAAQASVAPPTGVQAVPYAMGAGFTEMFGIPGGLTAAGATGLIARAYESAPVRNLLLKIGQSKPGSAQEGVLLRRAAKMIPAAIQSKIGSGIINDNVPRTGLAVASPDQGPDQQQ